MDIVLVSGVFDDFRSSHLRLLHEACRYGAVHVYIPNDEVVTANTGKPPHFPLAERIYVLQSVRYVASIHVTDKPVEALSFSDGFKPTHRVMREDEATPAKRAWAAVHGIGLIPLPPARLAGFPQEPPSAVSDPLKKKVVVTGCFDWFHSGHVRFFEEAAAFGDLYVIVGHDENLRLLKGEGHPLFPQEERRYMAGGVRFVRQALISSGHGWIDAEPEIAFLKPDIYVVNEDGDVPEKRRYCDEHGLEYTILKRTPKEGLPPRQSTDLRGY